MAKGKRFKHAAHLQKFKDCPPESYEERRMTMFRWVYDPDPETKSFKSQAEKNPARKFATAEDACCGHGLSMYNTESHARERWKTFFRLFKEEPAKRVKKMLGDHVDRVAIQPTHGVASGIREHDGHITFHEYEGVDLAKVSTRVGPLDV